MVDANDHKKGILIDLDIAARVRDGDTVLSPNLTYAGTIGFRSIDLLDTNTHYPTRTLYRDDLESFFYVLLYVLRFYRDGKRLRDPDNSGWWEVDGQIEDIGSLKLGFLSDPSIQRLPNSPLTAAWLLPLRSLIAEAYRSRGKTKLKRVDGQRQRWSDEQEETLNGMFTYASFMDIIS